MAESVGPSTPKQIVESGYDQVAEAYAGLEQQRWPRMRWLRKVLDELPPDSAVLDLGCGSGLPADAEIAKNHRVTGVDISAAQIELARRHVPGGTFLHGDACAVDLAAASFDAVISFYALEHIPRAEHRALLGRVHDWLRPEGLLLISLEAEEYDDRIGDWLGVPMFLSSFDAEGTERLIEAAGFDLLETAIESQVEQGEAIRYQWVLARRR